jgi:hypothetical protein
VDELAVRWVVVGHAIVVVVVVSVVVVMMMHLKSLT